MKDEDQFQTTVTTATLELGIDIGKLERAFQIDAPYTVSSFLQRMGRTGRRGQPNEMWFVMREEQPQPRSLLPSTVPWKLLQGIALVQLYRESKWVEPQNTDRLPFSLLYHQTLCTLAGEGELSPAALASRVLSLTPFRKISQDDYRILLRHLVETDQIARTERGGLIVGLAGERMTNSFKFYAVFQENEEYTVRCESSELGTIVQPPPVGEKVALAGEVWNVLEIDHKRKLVYRFMADFEDDKPYYGAFELYFPTYQRLNEDQLRGYFTWRTGVRNGAFDDSSTTYCFIYIYEILHNVGVDSPEQGAEILNRIWSMTKKPSTSCARRQTA